MSITRIFNSADFLKPAVEEPLRSVITESKEAVIVAWHVNPGQTIAPHVHPNGQDTWTVLSGQGQYYLDAIGNTKTIVSGDIAIAHPGSVHGVFNNGNEPLIFISVVSPSDAGYEAVSLEQAIEETLIIR